MAQTNNAPTVQVYNNPQPQAPPDDSAPDQPQPQAQPYPAQTYRPFVPPPGQRPGQGQDQAQPYTYQQYQNSYLPPSNVNNPQAQPMTLRQLGQQLPGALLQDVTRGATPTLIATAPGSRRPGAGPDESAFALLA